MQRGVIQPMCCRGLWHLTVHDVRLLFLPCVGRDTTAPAVNFTLGPIPTYTLRRALFWQAHYAVRGRRGVQLRQWAALGRM